MQVLHHHPAPGAGGHPAMARFLASKSAWLDSYDAEDNTPLHLAARWARGTLPAEGGEWVRI